MSELDLGKIAAEAITLAGKVAAGLLVIGLITLGLTGYQVLKGRTSH